MKEKTLCMLKPDSVRKNNIGKILSRFEEKGLKIIAARMQKLSKERAEEFYAIHKGKPFFTDLISFITSGPILAVVLEGDSAVAGNREIMGNTDPQKADKGTIRADFADNIDSNAVHGSDSLENAEKEISFFFTPEEVLSP